MKMQVLSRRAPDGRVRETGNVRRAVSPICQCSRNVRFAAGIGYIQLTGLFKTGKTRSGKPHQDFPKGYYLSHILNYCPLAKEKSFLTGHWKNDYEPKLSINIKIAHNKTVWAIHLLAYLNSDFTSKAKIFVGIVVTNTFHHLAQPLDVVRQLAILHILADKVAQDPAEIFVARVRQEAARIGKHAHKTA